MTLRRLDTLAKRVDGSEDIGNLDGIDGGAVEHGYATERAPSDRIARAKQHDTRRSSCRREVRDARVVTDECRRHPCDCRDGAQRLILDDSVPGGAKNTLGGSLRGTEDEHGLRFLI